MSNLSVNSPPADVGNLLAFHPIHSVIVDKFGAALWHTHDFFEDFDSEFIRDVLLRLDSEAPIGHGGGRSVFQLLYARSISEHPREYTVASQRTKDDHWIITIADRNFLDSEAAKADKENALLTKMLAVFAHEFRNPLVSVELSSELLREELCGRETINRLALENFAAVETGIQHMKRLLNDLDDYQRFSRGKISLRKKTFDLRQVVKEAVEKRTADSKRVQLSESGPANALMIGDAEQIRQVLERLLDNAIKFSPADTVVEVHLDQSNGAFSVCIKDAGLGMGTNTLNHVTEPFFQASQGISRGYGGLGLGAYFCQTIVRLHGGSLRYQSDGEGRGCTVFIDLPAVAQARDPLRHSSTPHTSPVAARNRYRPLTKVLIVEDHQSCLEAYRMVLADCHQAEVFYAESGKAAIELLQQHRFALVITDLGLPDLSGYQLIEAYKRDAGDDADTRFVLVTGYGSEEERFKSRMLGFSEHLVKPVSLQKLRSLILSETNQSEISRAAKPH